MKALYKLNERQRERDLIEYCLPTRVVSTQGTLIKIHILTIRILVVYFVYILIKYESLV